MGLCLGTLYFTFDNKHINPNHKLMKLALYYYSVLFFARKIARKDRWHAPYFRPLKAAFERYSLLVSFPPDLASFFPYGARVCVELHQFYRIFRISGCYGMFAF